MLYAILKDRHSLSVANNWVDKNNYIYVYCSRLEMAKLLKISQPTVKKAFDLLVFCNVAD